MKISEKPLTAEIQFTVNIREKEHRKRLQTGFKKPVRAVNTEENTAG